jgi:hypothetical protein
VDLLLSEGPQIHPDSGGRAQMPAWDSLGSDGPGVYRGRH